MEDYRNFIQKDFWCSYEMMGSALRGYGYYIVGSSLEQLLNQIALNHVYLGKTILSNSHYLN